MCKITNNKNICLANAAVPQHSLHTHCHLPSAMFEFTLHEHTGLSIFVCLFLKTAAQEGNKELNIILYLLTYLLHGAESFLRS